MIFLCHMYKSQKQKSVLDTRTNYKFYPDDTKMNIVKHTTLLRIIVFLYNICKIYIIIVLSQGSLTF